MKDPTRKGGFTLQRVLVTMLVAIVTSAAALAIWFVALLTAHSASSALAMVLKQAIWVIPVAMVLSLPVLMSLSARKQNETD